MNYSNSLTDSVSSRTKTAPRARRGQFTQAALGIVTAALCIGPVGLASAQTYHRHVYAHARDYMAQFSPGGLGGPVAGNWRNGLSAHIRQDHAYPMDESSGPATATGGPSGGIN